jgi:hypothetical protein
MQSEDIEIELLGQHTDENVCVNRVQHRERGLLMITSVFQEYTQNEATESPVEEVPPPSDAEPTDNDIDDLLPKEVMYEINIVMN